MDASNQAALRDLDLQPEERLKLLARQGVQLDPHRELQGAQVWLAVKKLQRSQWARGTSVYQVFGLTASQVLERFDRAFQEHISAQLSRAD